MAGLLASGPVGKECRIGRRDLADANADEQGRSSLPPDARAARGAVPAHYFAATFAQESLSVTVRLKTGLPGCESLASTQK